MSNEYDFQSLSGLPDDVVACRSAQGMDVCCGRCGRAFLQHLTDLGEDEYGLGSGYTNEAWTEVVDEDGLPPSESVNAILEDIPDCVPSYDEDEYGYRGVSL